MKIKYNGTFMVYKTVQRLLCTHKKFSPFYEGLPSYVHKLQTSHTSLDTDFVIIIFA